MDPIYSFEIRNGDFNRTEINFFRDTLPNSGSDMLAAIAIHTSWKGREDGAVYRAVVPADVSHAIYRELNELNHGLRPDAETAIRQWIKEFESDLKLASLFSGKSQNLNWTKIRTGTIVK